MHPGEKSYCKPKTSLKFGANQLERPQSKIFGFGGHFLFDTHPSIYNLYGQGRGGSTECGFDLSKGSLK